MKKKIFFIFLRLVLGVNSFWNIKIKNFNPAFDPKFYKDVLDTKQCQQQLDYITKKNVLLALQFVDAGVKLPRNILEGNLVDFGNYHQCLSIDHEIDSMKIKGKYCSILIDIGNIFNLQFKDKESNSSKPKGERSVIMAQGLSFQKWLTEYNLKLKAGQTVGDFYSRPENLSRNDEFRLVTLAMRLGICIPKVCSTHQAFSSSLLNVSTMYKEDFCRLPHDKPWSPADTTAVIIFSIIGILTVLCTTYDVTYKFILKKDLSDINSHLQTFSVYSNGCSLSSASGPATLHCLDGVRVLATAWVVLGHTVHTQTKILNVMDVFTWYRTLDSIYIMSAPLTVDTFFTIAGILLIYTNVEKITRRQLLKNLPQFYLNRLLRMFPILGTVVLLQASFFHRLSDGPMWDTVAKETNNCRTHWWITLLHLQNFINNRMTCLSHTWYLAIDVQLYIISPMVLFWVLGGSKKSAWLALTGGLLIVLTSATIYNFNKTFFPHILSPLERVDEMDDYMKYYYTNTLTRASPFFVGMVIGYLLHIYKGKPVYLSLLSVAVLWCSAAAVMSTIFFSTYFLLQEDWNHQFINNILNSFMRPAWGLGFGWLVFACEHGYGGPVNWFLSLDLWRIPARLCYGVYLFHYPIIFVVCDSVLGPVYFSPPRFMFMFTAYLTISFIVSYFATLLIGAPFSRIFIWMLTKQKKKNPVEIAKQIERVITENKLDDGCGHENEENSTISTNIVKSDDFSYNNQARTYSKL